MSDARTPGRQEAEPWPPAHPGELDSAWGRFERGDWRGATDEARALLAGQPSDEIAGAARDLLARMAPDRWALWVGVAALGLLTLLVALYVV